MDWMDKNEGRNEVDSCRCINKERVRQGYKPNVENKKKHEVAKKIKRKSYTTPDILERQQHARLHKRRTGYSLHEEEITGEK